MTAHAPKVESATDRAIRKALDRHRRGVDIGVVIRDAVLDGYQLGMATRDPRFDEEVTPVQPMDESDVASSESTQRLRRPKL